MIALCFNFLYKPAGISFLNMIFHCSCSLKFYKKSNPDKLNDEHEKGSCGWKTCVIMISPYYAICKDTCIIWSSQNVQNKSIHTDFINANTLLSFIHLPNKYMALPLPITTLPLMFWHISEVRCASTAWMADIHLSRHISMLGCRALEFRPPILLKRVVIWKIDFRVCKVKQLNQHDLM